MARRSRSGSKKRRRRGWKIASALLCCALVGLGALYAQSRVVNVRYATVYLADLSAGLDGLTVLFASDIDLKSEGEARAAAALFDRLSLLEPDVLLLGGDYAGPGLFDRLNGRDESDPALAAEIVAARHLFLTSLSDFPAPLGKFAVAAADDVLPEQLAGSMEAAGIRLLRDEAVALSRGGATLALAGLSAGGEGASAVARRLSRGDCALVFAASPDAFARALTAEAADGGNWADVLLAGGTHGGQVRLGDRTLLELSERERLYLSGWRKEGGAFLLTSQGVGCEGADLRLNTSAEVHLITLRRKGADNGIFMQRLPAALRSYAR